MTGFLAFALVWTIGAAILSPLLAWLLWGWRR
ncbi:hypothetical protein DFR74_12571 [Nocardia puris]|uniref:Uncharacterized protein n=1 Tax=Nocardia puris TaxID=208602 RepID=A0A366CWS7_9NOCA|nr:hypothetical protein DFR74_12571 [Nocardia puris]